MHVFSYAHSLTQKPNLINLGQARRPTNAAADEGPRVALFSVRGPKKRKEKAVLSSEALIAFLFSRVIRGFETPFQERLAGKKNWDERREAAVWGSSLN